MSVVPARPGLIVRRAEPVMGTVVSFDLRAAGLSRARTDAALAHARHVLHEADRVFSLYRPRSPISRVRAGRLAVADGPVEIAEVLALCAQVRDLSDGWFDPWRLPGGLDPSGLVKGWAAERAAAVLRRAGVGAAMVNAAGDVAVFGRPVADRGWRIGIRSPEAADRLVCVIDAEAAVATSGRYERGDHVIDPHSGRPARGARSASVHGPSLAVADALATGLLAAGPPGLAWVRRAGYEALLVDSTGAVIHSDGFPVVGGVRRRPSGPSSGPGGVRAVRVG